LQTGLSAWKGTISAEYLAELKPWSKAYKVYTQMADDAVIGALLDAIKLPLVAAGFDVELGGTTDTDKRAAEFLKSNIYSMNGMTWREHVDEALSFVEYGFSVHEKVLEKRKDGLLYMAALVPVGQDTLHEWGDPDKFGRTTSFKQRITTGGYKTDAPTSPGSDRTGMSSGVTELPMTKILHFVLNPRKRNPQGRSLLRNVYRPWYFKSNIEVLEAIGVERDVGNVPVVTIGEAGISSGDLTQLKEVLEHFRIDEAAYMILPYGLEIAAYGGGGKVYNTREIIEAWGHVMRQRLFADFIALGGGSVGTQALSREAQAFFFKALISIQKNMLEVWNTQLVPYLFQWNEGKFDDITKVESTGEPSYPRISWANPGRMDLINLATYISNLERARLMTPGRELEQHLRNIADLPPLAHDEEADSEKPEIVGGVDGEGNPIPPGGGGPTGKSPDGKKGGVSGDKQVAGGGKGQAARAVKEGGEHSEHAEHPFEFTTLKEIGAGAFSIIDDRGVVIGKLLVSPIGRGGKRGVFIEWIEIDEEHRGNRAVLRQIFESLKRIYDAEFIAGSKLGPGGSYENQRDIEIGEFGEFVEGSLGDRVRNAAKQYGRLNNDLLQDLVESAYPDEPASWRAWLHYARQVMWQTLREIAEVGEGPPPKEYRDEGNEGDGEHDFMAIRGPYYHVTPSENVPSIMERGLLTSSGVMGIGEAYGMEKQAGVYLSPDKDFLWKNLKFQLEEGIMWAENKSRWTMLEVMIPDDRRKLLSDEGYDYDRTQAVRSARGIPPEYIRVLDSRVMPATK